MRVPRNEVIHSFSQLISVSLGKQMTSTVIQRHNIHSAGSKPEPVVIDTHAPLAVTPIDIDGERMIGCGVVCVGGVLEVDAESCGTALH